MVAMRVLRWVIFIEVGAFLLGGAMNVYGKTLRLAVTSNVTSLDPIAQDNVTATSIILQIYEGLFGYGKSGNVEPRLVDRWEISPDNRLYTFTLKSGVRFSNGQELTAEDVKESLERVAKKESFNAWTLEMIDGYTALKTGRVNQLTGIKVVNPRTIQITLTEPYQPFLALLASAYFRIVTPTTPAEGSGCPPLSGTGPYVCLQSNPEHGVTLVRNPLYHAATNNVEEIIYRVMSYRDSTQAFNHGTLDVLRYYDDTYPITRTSIREILGYQFSTWHLAFNVERFPGNNEKLRHTIAAAVNRKKVTDTIGGHVIPAMGFLPPGFLVDHTQQVFGQERFPETHVTDLADVQLDLLLCSSMPKVDQVAALLSEAFQKIGVDVRTIIEPFGEFYRRRRKGEFSLVLANAMPDFGDPDAMLYPFFSSGSSGNILRHHDTVLDRLIFTARREHDKIQRAKMNSTIDQYLLQKAYIIPLYHDHIRMLIDRDLDMPPISGLGPWFLEYNNIRWSGNSVP